MKSFSQREGFKPVKSVIQINSIDNELRNSLWNALTLFYWDRIEDQWISTNNNMNILFKLLWIKHLKWQLDTLDDFWPTTHKIIKKIFFNFLWYEIYDFIEFIANNYSNNSVNQEFIEYCNSVLETELSAYRFVDNIIVPITSEVEISEIEEALDASKPLKAVNTHLRTSLDLLADKKNPDYRNSIKESISAIESICKIITHDKKATLGQTLTEIESKVELHPALKKAFSNLYGYTSDEQGIRHALMDESKLDFEDAKFMLVSCSAFINYLITKASKAGIKI